ncbi:MAG: 2-phospho-L-lactate guanylyltransferase [Acidimicrobiia bacterium]|nr:2-phospho-L-lactate guanylyltransferase [Acidimicrobiia bacterium]MBT8216013.1 2-phospho-L-lactate guanylyltransferase [Acidimicrobiia bacterium]NNF10744.1 2-phospho-L-lactate guanylyltransferase [Acidimicrobiia bacterium]NNL69227.1 2-phospho-L-lactate guanylyltransferase [Acidimicrobiia bacterium]
MLIAIPVKPFGVAKARLSPVLNAAGRSRLGRAVAAHTVGTALMTGERVAVVTGDDGVAAWARRLGAEVIRETAGGGLNGAADAAVAGAGGGDWLILHADLPGVAPADIEAARHLRQSADYVLAPSYDGGTSLIAGRGSFPFAYGAGSFHRHLRAAGGRARALVRTGLALDLDTPRDLDLARSLFAGTGFPGIPV